MQKFSPSRVQGDDALIKASATTICIFSLSQNILLWRSSDIIDQGSKDTCTDLGALGFQKPALNTPVLI